jgi:hypothetical protein
MSEKDINRWLNTITPRDKAPQPWTLGSGGSWDMQEVQPIPDAMLAELAERYYYAGTPWNCRSMPLSDSDREYMYLLYTSMQGLVARMRLAEKRAAEADALQVENQTLRVLLQQCKPYVEEAYDEAGRGGTLADRSREDVAGMLVDLIDEKQPEWSTREPECKYGAWRGTVCNKCGQLHT